MDLGNARLSDVQDHAHLLHRELLEVVQTENLALLFRQAGQHPILSELAHEAAKILRRIPEAEFRTGHWDPFAFIAFCDRARSQPGSAQELAAMEIQRAEWQLLFDYSARRR
jgi:hypothetical protein